MGFLDIFRKSEIKSYNLGEAIAVIREELEKLQNKNKEESYQAALKIHQEIRTLILLIDEFSKKEIYDRAKSSAAVKERFCNLSRKQLSSLEEPSKDNPTTFLNSIRAVLGNIGGLTERQMVHISFFFKDDFRPVAKKIGEINIFLDVEETSGDHQKAVSLYDRLEWITNRNNNLSELILINEDRLKQIKEKHLPELAKQPNNFELLKNEAKLKSIKQEVDSFLAIQKVLKKYVYIGEVKDKLIGLYIESPSTALAMDNDLKIIDFAIQASLLVRKGKIENDKKLETIINSHGYLQKKRDELIDAENDTFAEKEKYSSEQELFETSIKTRTNRLAEMEGEIKDLKKAAESMKEEISSLQSEAAKKNAELHMLASKLLNANII